MKILFVKVGNKITDGEKNKIVNACMDLYKNYFNYGVTTIESITTSFDGEPVFETTDFPQGKLSFLSGRTILSCIDKIETEVMSPIIVWVTDPQPQLTMANICYKLINKYGIVNCSVVSDDSMEHYIVHEVVHAFHEWLLRKGIKLPDTQDEDIMKAGRPDATTPEHQAIVKKNAEDLIPHINKVSWEPVKATMLVSLLTMVVNLLKKLLELKGGSNLKAYTKEQAIKNGLDYKVLMATIEAESGWDTRAIGLNLNGSRDFGVCQINDEWWIGSNSKAAQSNEYYFPSSDYVLNNPKECIDWMIKQWVKGRQNYWYGYKNGVYKKFLNNY